MDGQQYCLKWNNFSQHLKYAFNTIWSNDDSFTDVTLAIQGGFKMRGHKMVLSACSYYFKKLLVADTSESTMLILHDVTRVELEALVHFMYHGEVNVTQEVIPGLLKAAEMLQIRGLCAAPPQGAKSGSAGGSAGGRAGKRAAAEPTPPGATPAKKRRGRPPANAQPTDTRGRTSVESEDSRDTNGVAGGSDNDGEGQLRIDENSNGGLEPETLLDEQDNDGDGWSQDSGGTDDQFFPLPRAEDDSPGTYTATTRLKKLAVKCKLEPPQPNDLEAAIVASLPKNDSVQGTNLNSITDDRFLAFHMPRPCPHCRRMYRDAATLRTHVAIMHAEVAPPRAPGRVILQIPRPPSRPPPLPLARRRPVPASRAAGTPLYLVRPRPAAAVGMAGPHQLFVRGHVSHQTRHVRAQEERAPVEADAVGSRLTPQEPSPQPPALHQSPHRRV